MHGMASVRFALAGALFYTLALRPSSMSVCFALPSAFFDVLMTRSLMRKKAVPSWQGTRVSGRLHDPALVPEIHEAFPLPGHFPGHWPLGPMHLHGARRRGQLESGHGERR